jgi:hypothetical protein
MFMSPVRLRPEKDSDREAQQQLKTTDLTSGQSGRPKSTQTRNCLKIIKERRRKIGRVTPRQTGRLTAGRNITFDFDLEMTGVATKSTTEVFLF